MSIKNFSDILDVKHEHLKKVSVSKMPEHQISSVCGNVIPTFNYNNAYHVAANLEQSKIVYGIVLIEDSGTKIPMEHAWVKTASGEYYDITCQLLEEKKVVNSEHYSMLELSLDDYMKLSSDTYSTPNSVIIAPDFIALRESKKYQSYFSKCAVRD